MSDVEYCAYRHFSSILDHGGGDWIIGMFTAYWDDSGTDASSPLAIASCYVSTKRGWGDFVTQWDDARHEEGFDVFHMTDFAARKERGCKPFCDWDKTKRQHVYTRLAKIINTNKRVGFGIAIPKDAFDSIVPELPDWLRFRVGENHFVYAVRVLMGMIKQWREESGIVTPMQYVFDRMGKGRGSIEGMWHGIEKREDWAAWYGMERDGCSFQNKADFKPLQAADILAWQLNNHMQNVIRAGKDELVDTHPNFRILREDQEVRLGFITADQFRASMERELAFRLKHGQTATTF